MPRPVVATSSSLLSKLYDPIRNKSTTIGTFGMPPFSMLVVFLLRHISIRQTVVCSHQREFFSLNVRDPSI